MKSCSDCIAIEPELNCEFSRPRQSYAWRQSARSNAVSNGSRNLYKHRLRAVGLQIQAQGPVRQREPGVYVSNCGLSVIGPAEHLPSAIHTYMMSNDGSELAYEVPGPDVAPDGWRQVAQRGSLGR